MKIRINGTRLYFDVEGAALQAEGPSLRERPTVILVHGGPGLDHSWFKPAHAALAEVAQVVYLDLRGQGRSDLDNAERWTLAQWADDLRDFCDGLDIRKPVVLGSSFGGMVAMKYAAAHPEHPGKLVLVSSMARLVLDRMLAAFERLGGERARETARAFWQKPCAETLPAYLERCFPLYTRRPRAPDALQRVALNLDVLTHFAGGEMQAFDLRAELCRVHCPTLLIAGEDDPIAPPEASEEIAAALPAGAVRLVRFAGCGHEVVNDNPQGYFGLVKDFLAGR
jgi:proline iminopeptidase